MAIKETAVLLLVALSVATAEQMNPAPTLFKKQEIASSMPVHVAHSGAIAVPIDFVSADYRGPYNPLDPKGLVAARNREMQMANNNAVNQVRSYVPPGMGKLAKKEATKLALDEGRRFTVSHPKEAADILVIATKAKDIYDHAQKKVKRLEMQDLAASSRQDVH